MWILKNLAIVHVLEDAQFIIIVVNIIMLLVKMSLGHSLVLKTLSYSCHHLKERQGN